MNDSEIVCCPRCLAEAESGEVFTTMEYLTEDGAMFTGCLHLSLIHLTDVIPN